LRLRTQLARRREFTPTEVLNNCPLVAWSSGIISACHQAMGREFESRQGIEL
jgi:hypothetical protein